MIHATDFSPGYLFQSLREHPTRLFSSCSRAKLFVRRISRNIWMWLNLYSCTWINTNHWRSPLAGHVLFLWHAKLKWTEHLFHCHIYKLNTYSITNENILGSFRRPRITFNRSFSRLNCLTVWQFGNCIAICTFSQIFHAVSQLMQNRIMIYQSTI